MHYEGSELLQMCSVYVRRVLSAHTRYRITNLQTSKVLLQSDP